MQTVAIGASAGGIGAFGLFFESMPADSGMGFVVRRLYDQVVQPVAMRVSEGA